MNILLKKNFTQRSTFLLKKIRQKYFCRIFFRHFSDSTLLSKSHLRTRSVALNTTKMDCANKPHDDERDERMAQDILVVIRYPLRITDKRVLERTASLFSGIFKEIMMERVLRF